MILPLLINLAGQVLPGIVGAIAGSKGKDIAEVIVDAGTKVFGAGADEPTIAAKIEADPQILEQYKAALESQLALRKLSVEEFKIGVQDVQHARGRDADVRQVSGGTNPRANIMLMGTFLVLVTTVAGVIYYRSSLENEVLMVLGGVIGSCMTLLGQAFNFEFGSSRGSSEKTDILISKAMR